MQALAVLLFAELLVAGTRVLLFGVLEEDVVVDLPHVGVLGVFQYFEGIGVSQTLYVDAELRF